MSYDMVSTPLATGMDKAIGSNGSGYDKALIFTHYRVAMALFGVSIALFHFFLRSLDDGTVAPVSRHKGVVSAL